MNETTDVVELPIPLPADLEGFEAEYEETDRPAPQLLLPTLADAQRALGRVRKIRRQGAEIAEVFDDEIDALWIEIERLRERKAEALKPFERRESWYAGALEQFARAQLAQDPKAKTIKLPAGDLILRTQQPEWTYRDEQATITALWGRRPELIRIKHELNKADLRKVAKVQNGIAYVVTDDGELVELPIAVTDRPPSFSLKVEV